MPAAPRFRASHGAGSRLHPSGFNRISQRRIAVINLTYTEAMKKAEHLKALGQTTIYIHREAADFPYGKVTNVEAGSSWRLGGPSSCYLIAEDGGLTFKLNVDFEGRDANGRGVSLFDRDKLREMFVRLPSVARQAFADLLESECLPSLAKRRSELQAALNDQADSEDCVRGLIMFAREKEAA
jgi:hypothetical protein